MKITYPAQSTVSIWLGKFESEDEFDRIVEAHVTPALRLPADVDIASICEMSWESTAVPAHQLLEGFSGWQSFIEEATGAVKAQGIEAANCALVCYYLRCEGAPVLWGELAFLGSFRGQDGK